jgi:hypothetical protein
MLTIIHLSETLAGLKQLKQQQQLQHQQQPAADPPLASCSSGAPLGKQSLG